MIAILLIVTLYLVPGGQAGITYPLWIKAHIDRSAGGLAVPITWFQSFTAIASIAAPPMLIRFWRWQAARGAEPNDVTKLAIGCAFSVAAFLWLAGVAWFGRGRSPSWLWLAPHHLLYSFGYLFVWPVGMALFTRSAPGSLTAMFVGLYFLSLFMANTAAGILGGIYERMAPHAFWAMNAGVVAAGLAILLVFGGSLGRALVVAETKDSA